MSSKANKSPKQSVSSPKSVASPSSKQQDLEAVDLKLLKGEEVPVVVTKRVNALKNVQLKMVEIEAKFYEELHELECKFAKFYEPLYEKRKQIITGEYEPTDEEGKWFLDEEEEDEEIEKGAETKPAIKSSEPEIDESKLHPSGKELLNSLKAQFNGKHTSAGDEKGIFNFWLETLQSFRITSELIQEHDEPILSFLQDIRVVLFDKKPYGYTLEFHFAENPYFTNKCLTKTYELKTDVDVKDPFAYEGPDLARTVGCKIDWKQGKNVTVKVTKKKLKAKNKKQLPKVITKEEKQESFFQFFDTPVVESKLLKTEEKQQVALVGGGKKQRKSTGGGDTENDEDEDENNDHTEILLIADFEIGQYMREKIVPKAVLYYTGEYDDMDEYDDEFEDEEDEDGEEDDDEDGEEDDEDEDDDDDEEEDDDSNKKGNGNKSAKKQLKKPALVIGGKPGAGKGAEATPTECKQS